MTPCNCPDCTVSSEDFCHDCDRFFELGDTVYWIAVKTYCVACYEARTGKLTFVLTADDWCSHCGLAAGDADSVAEWRAHRENKTVIALTCGNKCREQWESGVRTEYAW